MTQRCRQCGILKSLSEFGKAKSCVSGYRRTCRACNRTVATARQRAWRSNNREKIAAYSKRWRIANPESTLMSNKRGHELATSRKQEYVDSHGGGCERCGYSRCLSAIEFHHVDPNTKTKCITANTFIRKYAETLEELKHTVVLCCRCHRELHSGLDSK